MPRELSVILSKREWENVLAGRDRTLRIFQENELHHYFGDKPEDDIVRVNMTELTPNQQG